MPKLLIGWQKGKGRCVYAGEAIAKGNTIDTNPVILAPSESFERAGQPLVSYPFGWVGKDSALPLGSITLVNHSAEPNAVLERDLRKLMIRLIAIRDIAPGEEIGYDYKVPLWFEAVEPKKVDVP